jgi:hypothetical protein
LNKWTALAGIFIGISCILATNIANAQEDLTFRQRNARMIIPKYEEASPKITNDGPKLVFSDSPELVSDCGVMYRDTLSGKVRLFFHHVNNTTSDKKLAVVLRNSSFRPVQVTIGNRGISQPRRDWLLAGKEAQGQYFKSEGHTTSFRLIRYQELLSWHDGQRIRPHELITGIMDLDIAQPVEISILMLPLKTNFDSALDVYQPLPPDEGNVLRGTFPTSNCHVHLQEPFETLGDKIVEIKLADDVKNPYVRGIDALTGREVFNNGNYGVIYDVHFATKGKGETLIKFSPEGGVYAGYGKVGEEGKAALVAIPPDKTSFGVDGRNDAIVIGTIPGEKQGEVVFSPPGSSNLPIKIILIPEKVLQKNNN